MKNDNKRQLSEDEIAESTESPKNKTMRTYIYSSDIDIEEHHPIKVRYSEKNKKIKKNLSLCVDVTYVLNFYPPKFCFRILKLESFTSSKRDRHLLRQKVCQIISVIMTNTCVFAVFKTKRELKCQNELFF